jgi:hypothetical protein
MAVIVENYSPDARPQTGLSSASLVFETDAEYGITRFMAVYLENIPPVVGPVRSARVYFDSWADGLHAVYVHAGGNDDALAQLFKMHNVADVNEVKWEDQNYNPTVPFFKRSPDRVIPHNMYTFPPLVETYEKTQKQPLTGDFPDSFPHKAPSSPEDRPSGAVLDINFSSPDYAVEYRYNHATNRWLRFMGGTPHLEASTGHQLAPTNVVVLAATIKPDPAGVTAGSVYVQTTGTNTAYYFIDGKESKGTWTKWHDTSRLMLLDAHGHAVKLDPGQTWIDVLPTGGTMSFTPGK